MMKMTMIKIKIIVNDYMRAPGTPLSWTSSSTLGLAGLWHLHVSNFCHHPDQQLQYCMIPIWYHSHCHQNFHRRSFFFFSPPNYQNRFSQFLDIWKSIESSFRKFRKLFCPSMPGMPVEIFVDNTAVWRLKDFDKWWFSFDFVNFEFFTQYQEPPVLVTSSVIRRTVLSFRDDDDYEEMRKESIAMRRCWAFLPILQGLRLT